MRPFSVSHRFVIVSRIVANTIGLTAPPTLLALANEVIA